MNALFNKPNLLFLIFVRNQNLSLLLSKLRRPVYRTKLIKALTEIRIQPHATFYFLNGEFHRMDGPAIDHIDGTKQWCVHGNSHRDDGPAVIWADGGQQWWVNGILHRTDGPAFIWADGTQAWYINGEKHRVDGPARIYSDGYQEWWINNKKVDPF